MTECRPVRQHFWMDVSARTHLNGLELEWVDDRTGKIQNGSLKIHFRSNRFSETSMPVNLSIKNVPDALAERLRDRAARNRRSLQAELMAMLEWASQVAPTQSLGSDPVLNRLPPAPPQRPRLTVDEVYERALKRFPNGTESSVDIIREMRDTRYGDGT